MSQPCRTWVGILSSQIIRKRKDQQKIMKEKNFVSDLKCIPSGYKSEKAEGIDALLNCSFSCFLGAHPRGMKQLCIPYVVHCHTVWFIIRKCVAAILVFVPLTME